MVRNDQDWSGMIRTVRDRWGQVSISQDRPCQVRTGEDRPDQTKTVQVGTGRKPFKTVEISPDFQTLFQFA